MNLKWIAVSVLGGAVLAGGYFLYRRNTTEPDQPGTSENANQPSVNQNGKNSTFEECFVDRSGRPENISRDIHYLRRELTSVIHLVNNHGNDRIADEVNQLINSLKKGEQKLKTTLQ